MGRFVAIEQGMMLVEGEKGEQTWSVADFCVKGDSEDTDIE